MEQSEEIQHGHKESYWRCRRSAQGVCDPCRLAWNEYNRVRQAQLRKSYQEPKAARRLAAKRAMGRLRDAYREEFAQFFYEELAFVTYTFKTKAAK